MSRATRFSGAALLALGLLAPAPRPARATGTDYYVSPSGSDGDPGTAEAPWGSVGQSLRRLSPGDTLWVRGGTYRERITTNGFRAGSPSAPVRVIAYPGERPLIKGVLWIRYADYWAFDGIDVTWDAERNGARDFLLKIMSGVGWSYRNAEIWGARWVGNVYIGTAVEGQPARWTLSGNCIHDNDARGAYLTDHNIYLDPGLGSGPGVIERNILFNAENGYNIKAAGPDRSGGAANVAIRNNTMASAAEGVTVAFGSHHITLERNLIGPRAGGKSWYPAIRGAEAFGERNGARSNAAHAVARVLLNTDSSTGIADLGGNRLLDPRFDSITSCRGFHPRDPSADAYGRYAPELVSGDWDGNGTETPGLFTGGYWRLRNSNSTGAADASFAFGRSGDVPIAGDWDGDGRGTIGVVRGNTVYLRNSNTAGRPDRSFTYGAATDRFIAGDWNGDGLDTIGVVRGNTVYLRNQNSTGRPDRSFTYGTATDRFVAGDWNGDGRTTLGTVGAGAWSLREANSTGGPDLIFRYSG
ncbi:MAG: VCBS repeat-containing protein [Acidobacteria bacterium]|nr:VCBS repeat-containing protein [Acidobacteriota bacterium]